VSRSLDTGTLPAVTWSETQDGREWEDFVVKNHGTALQSWAWRDVGGSTSNKPRYLVCRDAKGALRAVCPFFLVKSGRYLYTLSSLPSTIEGGPLFASDVGDVSLEMESLRRSIRFSIWKRIGSLQVSVYDKRVVNALLASGHPHRIEWGVFILDLRTVSLDRIWTGLFDNEDRRNIKYFDSLGCSLRIAETDRDYDEFLALENESMQRRGHFQLPREILARFRSSFGENFRLLEVVSPDGGLVAAVTLLSNPDKTMVHWTHVGYVQNRSSKSAYYYAIWKLVNWASAEGFRYVDLGGTRPDPTDPVYKVKRRFGADFFPIYTFAVPVSSRLLSIAKRFHASVKSTGKSGPDVRHS
jgi:CelD/BcsL family acetyltransferase involved in cellulose biosynthesis